MTNVEWFPVDEWKEVKKIAWDKEWVENNDNVVELSPEIDSTDLEDMNNLKSLTPEDQKKLADSLSAKNTNFEQILNGADFVSPIDIKTLNMFMEIKEKDPEWFQKELDNATKERIASDPNLDQLKTLF